MPVAPDQGHDCEAAEENQDVTDCAVQARSDQVERTAAAVGIKRRLKRFPQGVDRETQRGQSQLGEVLTL
jgi:hypothetical protein